MQHKTTHITHPMNIDIQKVKNVHNKHMKYRCYCLFTSCILSLHTWYIYPSLFITDFNVSNNLEINSFLNLYHKNYFLGIHILWDVCSMTLSQNRKILFRTDLMIHHATLLFLLFKYFNILPIIWSKFTIVECISVMNYIWRNNKNLLKIYRTFCILFIRIPLSLLFFFNFYNNDINNTIEFPYFKSLCFMIIYDAYIIWKLYK